MACAVAASSCRPLDVFIDTNRYAMLDVGINLLNLCRALQRSGVCSRRILPEHRVIIDSRRLALWLKLHGVTVCTYDDGSAALVWQSTPPLPETSNNNDDFLYDDGE